MSGNFKETARYSRQGEELKRIPSDSPPPITQGESAVTRLTDLPPAQAKRLAEAECPKFETTPWVTGPALSRRRIAIVSSAGLVVRGEMPFRGREEDYRAIPADTRPEDLLVSHISINFDRTGLQEDWNVAFPLEQLKELAADGAIGPGGRDRLS